MEKYISDDTLCYLAFKLYLKTTVLDLVKKNIRAKTKTVIGAKFPPPYSILFIAELEDEILRRAEFKPYLSYIDDIFSFGGTEKKVIYR